MKQKTGASISKLQQQIVELTKALQHERADSLNLRRRVNEERLAAANFYKASVVKEILPVLDNLVRIADHRPKTFADDTNPYTPEIWEWINGIELTGKEARKIMQKLDLEQIKTVGEKFDPRLHEAVHMEDGEGEHEVVSEELQPGYKIGDEVIRPAMVKVKKG